MSEGVGIILGLLVTIPGRVVSYQGEGAVGSTSRTAPIGSSRSK
jgi:hypothetical protein